MTATTFKEKHDVVIMMENYGDDTMGIGGSPDTDYRDKDSHVRCYRPDLLVTVYSAPVSPLAVRNKVMRRAECSGQDRLRHHRSRAQ